MLRELNLFSELKSLSRPGLALRKLRVASARARRLAAWGLTPARWPTPRLAAPGQSFAYNIYRASVSIARNDPWAHPVLEAGKRHNLALAAPAFDGMVITSARPLSFWRVLGPAVVARGYVSGMELAGGCVVPSIGGGLCLLSNVLFEAAARLGWRIHERHGHSVEVVPAPAGRVFGLDATVFWPHVDLVVAPVHGSARLSVQVCGEELVLRVDSDEPSFERVSLQSIDERIEPGHEPVRHNRILRRVLHQATGRVLRADVIAVNRTRLRHGEARGRSCLTCDEVGCGSRREVVAAAPLRSHRS